MKNVIKNILPRKLRYLVRTIRKFFIVISNYIYDIKRHFKYTSEFNDNSMLKLEAKIIENYHVLEKGLSMVDRKEVFGKKKAKELVDLLKRYINMGYPTERSQIQSAIKVLKQYFEAHSITNDTHIKNLEKDSNNFFDYLLNDLSISGGSREVTKEEIINGAKGDFRKVANSRFSIRNFTPKNVEVNSILNAIEIAKKTPSACNRQSSHVYIISDKEKIKEVLSIQNGNRGFGHLINKLLIVTSNLNAFKGPNERYQSYIDGGMFAMSLLYSLHYEGLGACPLNWSVTKDKDKKIRNCIDIKDSENVIMLIGVGNIPEKLSIAVSERKSLNEIVREL